MGMGPEVGRKKKRAGAHRQSHIAETKKEENKTSHTKEASVSSRKKKKERRQRQGGDKRKVPPSAQSIPKEGDKDYGNGP